MRRELKTMDYSKSNHRIRAVPRSKLLRLSANVIKGIAIATCTSLVLSGCTLTQSLSDYSAEDPAILRYADYAPATASGPLDEFSAELNENSQGRMKIEPYWGGSLLGPSDLPSGLRAGIADIGIFTATQHAAEYPVTNWLASTVSAGSKEFPEGVLQTYAGLADFAYNSKEVNDQFETLGLKLLVPLHTILKYDLSCTSPIETLDDAAGKRVRSGGPLWDGEIRAAGMVPVTLPINETYEGLQRGVVDCAIANPRTAVTYGFTDIAKYYVDMPFSGINSQYVVMNQSSWDALTLEDQRILWDATHSLWSENLRQDGIEEYQKLYKTGEKEQGLTFLTGDEKLQRSITNYQEKKLKELPSHAPSTVDDPEKPIDDYTRSLDHWLHETEEMNLGDKSKDLDLEEYFARTKKEIWGEKRP